MLTTMSKNQKYYYTTHVLYIFSKHLKVQNIVKTDKKQTKFILIITILSQKVEK